MSVDKRGLESKKIILNQLPKVLQFLVEDGAKFLVDRIEGEVLKGPDGNVYPKTGYATGIAQGQTGFIGVVSGNLRRDVDERQGKDKYQKTVFMRSGGSSDYVQDAANFVFQKYGADFMEIAVQLYGDFLYNTMRKEVGRFFAAVNARRGYNYQNPFPG